MKEEIRELIKKSLPLVAEKDMDKKINDLIKTHIAKIHFIPLRCRVFGGFVHSLNIKFGNFIQKDLLKNLFEYEKRFEIMGKKDVPLNLTRKTQSLLNDYLTECLNNKSTRKCNSDRFKRLLEDITDAQKADVNSSSQKKYDIDILLKEKKNGFYHYIEVKYNDDHDTGKFENIPKKFLETYAALVKDLEIEKTEQLKPILCYFTEKEKKENPSIPKENIYRNGKFFEEFFNEIKYEDIKNFFEDEVFIFKDFDKILFEKIDDLLKKWKESVSEENKIVKIDT